ncbi:hypothetical protein JOF29_007030 [Kribbella aluminosa]|uniref:Uncharacterized protein n=1 Tax=Kribbella aluminosa TaxID=416017 RepID=A0ABS4UWC0_9ACTN|nr:hypothetical protein [Kribbella aluminosa]MBP2355920.1 hypothetical protein [Kribbella aluminosa]
MARRRKATKLDDLGGLTVVAVLAYLGYPPKDYLLEWIVIGTATVLFWIAFLMPTKCDYLTQRRKPCDRGVRGKLRGCSDHGRWKRDAMWAALGGANPGRLFRVMWAAPDSRAQPRSVRTPGSPAESNAKRGLYDLLMLLTAIISAAGAVLALVVK